MPFAGDAAPYVSAGLEFLGGMAANNANAKSVDKQLAFQDRMSSTAYQRATRDMQLAGLNPALAYQQGGASSPSGASYDSENVGGDAARGFASGTSAKALMQATAADIDLKRAAALKTRAEARQIDLESNLNVENLQENVNRTHAEAFSASQLGSLRGIEFNYLYDTYHERVAAGKLSETQARQQLEVEKAKVRNMDADTLRARVMTHLGRLAIPKAANEAGMQGTAWKKYISPFISDATSLARVISNFSTGGQF